MFSITHVPSASMRMGIIDVGSNSTHLLVVDLATDGHITEVLHERKQLRLAEFKNADGTLGQNAVTALSTILQKMRSMATELGATCRAVGTFAIRDASNWAEFCEKVRKRSDVDIEVVSGQEEARLIHLGILYGFNNVPQPLLAVDIGGGSAELVIAEERRILYSASLKLGAVHLSKRFTKGGEISNKDIAEMREYILERLLPVVARLRKYSFQTAVVSGGTGKTILGLAMGLKGKDTPKDLHGSILNCDDVSHVFSTLCAVGSLKERRSLKGMDTKRADIIVAGAMVLDLITNLLKPKEWLVSNFGVREGTLIDNTERELLWKRGDALDPRRQFAFATAVRFGVDLVHANLVTKLVLQLFEGLGELHGLSLEWREYLRVAALLHECGLFVDFSSYHKHSWYIIHNLPLEGYHQRERAIIAAIIRFHRKRIPLGSEEEFKELRDHEVVAVSKLAALLRIAVTLDRTRQGRVSSVMVEGCANGAFVLAIEKKNDVGIEFHALEAEKNHFEKVFGVALTERLLQSG